MVRKLKKSWLDRFKDLEQEWRLAVQLQDGKKKDEAIEKCAAASLKLKNDSDAPHNQPRELFDKLLTDMCSKVLVDGTDTVRHWLDGGRYSDPMAKGEVAKKLGIHTNTLARKIKVGKIRAINVDHRTIRVHLDDLKLE